MFSETTVDAWVARYGSQPKNLSDVAGRFLTHRSVRTFLPEPIDESTAAYLVACAQSAATSSHIQAWSIVSIQSPERRSAVNNCCGNQTQIEHAAWFFAFCLDIGRSRQMAKANALQAPATDTLEFTLIGTIDAALAAERMVCSAEALGLGTCYIGALRNEPAKIQQLLSLPEGVIGLFGLCVGKPDPNDFPEIKPRLPQSAVWFCEQYVPNEEWRDLDARMTESYERSGSDPHYTWSQRMARRCEDKYLGGRIELRFVAEKNRLNLR